MEKVVANTMFFTYLSASCSISSLVKLPAIETISLNCFRNHHARPMVLDLHVLPCFSHMIMNLWNERVFLEKCIPFSRKSYGVLGEKRTRSKISEIRILLLANSSKSLLMTAGPGVTKCNASKKRSGKVSYFVPWKQIPRGLRELKQILQSK